MLRAVYQRPQRRTAEKYLRSSQALRIPKDLLEKFNLIYTWREHHAAIIDESPSAMFTESQILCLLSNPPKTEDDIIIRTRRPVGSKLEMKSPESIGTWKRNLFHMVTEGKTYYDKIMSIKCHNCRKAVGHAAWGCPEPWNPQATKLNLKENPEAKTRQNRRRRQNRNNNRRQRLLAAQHLSL